MALSLTDAWAAAEYEEEIAAVPCLAPYCASRVFCEGVLRDWCDWKALDAAIPAKAEGANSEAYLRQFLANCTDLRRFPLPQLPSAVIQVAARYDQYIPGTGDALHGHWKGSELRWIPHGHITGYLFGISDFIAATVDAFTALVHHKRAARDSSKSFP